MAAPVSAFAEAGSTGGTIGKQDKSASGGEVPAGPERGRPSVGTSATVAWRIVTDMTTQTVLP